MRLLSRALAMALSAVSVFALMGCTATVAGGGAKTVERGDTDGANVALLDTGNYPIAAGHPLSTAGSAAIGSALEAHRIAANVVGPWQIDATFRRPAGPLNLTTTGPLGDARSLAENKVLADPIPDVVAKHGFIAGFSSLRAASPTMLLINVVLRFPDADSADAAASEMADNVPFQDMTPRRMTIDRHPGAFATFYDGSGGTVIAISFGSYGGPYVLIQEIQILDRNDSAAAPALIAATLDKQEPLIDRFTPTDPTKLADLPKDPTGQQLAHTLWAPDNSAPYMGGVWDANAWLHFEDDPVKAADLFKSAGVEMVTQRMTTVYQTRDAAGAAHVAEQFAEDIRALDGVHPISGITGLPEARCFARSNVSVEPGEPLTVLRVNWPFKCVARADRYAFIAFSSNEKDVKQQIAAQYRILAGK
jgi:hypothetical protein